jgi:predicted DNA-binding transcriptional regulator YafY
MVNTLFKSLKWEQRQRLTLLEATVFWSGEVSTASLTQYFGISRVQASKDFTLYQTLCPDNIRYDKSLKRYVLDDAFKAAFMVGSAGEFLQILKVHQGDSSNTVVVLADNLPIVEVLEPVFRQVDPTILQTINQAILSDKVVKVRYQSMSRAESVEHQLCPHTLVFDGLRWHTRAFSYTHHEFRDFVLARIHSAETLGPAEMNASEDVHWDTFVPVKIGAHPGLSDTQKAAIEFDYGMVNGIFASEVRGALLYYFLRTMRIGTDDLIRDAMVQQIVLLNREDLSEYLQF